MEKDLNTTDTELAVQGTNTAMVLDKDQVIYGFEDTNNEDIIIPRIKVINALSPERTEGSAKEGDVLNSLTGENVAGKRFIPIRQYYSNIWWNADRDADDRFLCRSADGRIGNDENGTLSCAVCKKNQFDNTKEGKDAHPVCTAYLNFLGFFEDSPMPVVLSFSKTNYNDGKKMLSIAKSLRSSLWNYAYVLEGKKVTKGKNTWYNILPTFKNDTTAEERAMAFELYKAYSEVAGFQTNFEDTTYTAPPVSDAQTESEIG